MRKRVQISWIYSDQRFSFYAGLEGQIEKKNRQEQARNETDRNYFVLRENVRLLEKTTMSIAALMSFMVLPIKSDICKCPQ